jgi:hypothetical protein
MLYKNASCKKYNDTKIIVNFRRRRFELELWSFFLLQKGK